MLKTVLSYVERGWAVFPCKDKIPLTSHGFKDAVKDKVKAEKIFAQYKNANIGIATGRISGIFVVDIDVKNEAEGEISIKELEKEYGELPHTVEALTWSGGRHIFFRYPDKKQVGCKTGIRSGIDIRGDGGYVIASPSAVNGKTYEWEVSHHPEDTMIADAPEWLLTFLEKKEVDLSNKKTKIGKGNRNETLMKIGVHLRKLGLEYANIESSLRAVNKERCTPALASDEVSRIAQSVSRYNSEIKKLQKRKLTDVWNANLFFQKYGNNIKYCDELGGWFIWDECRWKKDNTFQILKLAKNTVKQIFQTAETEGNKDLYKHALKSESESKLKAMINLVRCEDNISIENRDFDNNEYLLNLKNGTLDLITGLLKSHDKNDYITKKIELDYNPSSKCMLWEKFLLDIFNKDTELIEFMQKAVGYSLSASMKEQCIFILYGIGMNGKSTFLKHIFKIFGDYALNTPASTLMEKYNDSIPNDIARLKGMRFVTALESGKSKSLAEAQIKQLTGDDPITARFLHKEYFDFFATFKIFFATNHKPNISGTDKGIWRRIVTIPFEKIISPQERDDKLDEKLKEEYEGILNWSIQGFRKWQEQGLKRPAKITEATAEYKEESDVIGGYISERCFKGDSYRVSTSEILKDIQEWAKDGGLRHIKRNEFIDYMQKQGFKKQRVTAGKNKGNVFWFGIGLKSEDEFDLSENRGNDICPF